MRHLVPIVEQVDATISFGLLRNESPCVEFSNHSGSLIVLLEQLKHDAFPRWYLNSSVKVSNTVRCVKS